MKYLVIWLAVVCICLFSFLALTGCSTINGAARDLHSGTELIINATQKYVDKQTDDSIAFAINEQNRILGRGIKYQQYVSLKNSSRQE